MSDDDFDELAEKLEDEERSLVMPDVLAAVNRGRALRGAPPIAKLPSFHDDPEQYE